MQGTKRDIIELYIVESVGLHLFPHHGSLICVLSLTKQFTYLEYLKDTTRTTKYWVSTGDTTQERFCNTPLGSSELSQAHETQKLPFLCTNSAPHTTQVDTDFSESPKTNVTSNGVVFTG